MTNRLGDRLFRAVLVCCVSVMLGACASTTPGDPFESYNRKMHAFNKALDSAVLEPTAKAYKNYFPLAVRSITRNFFANIADVWTGANNFLQAKPVAALNDWTRVLLNSTFGFFGISDPASEMGWEKNNEDFGQTLGVWGVPTGPYLVLPLFGPSSIRGTGGLIIDYYGDPLVEVSEDVNVLWGLAGLRLIDTRSKFLGATRVLQGAALDEYSFVRDAYKQRRLSLVYDGDPPLEDEEPLPNYEDEEDDDPKTPQSSKTDS